MADQGAEGLLSPYLRRRRVAAAVPHIKGCVLDVGCGSGPLAQHVASACYVGIDLDAESIRIARMRFPDHSFEQLELIRGKRFDTIVALAVIEHVGDRAQFLQDLKECLETSEDARIVGTTPHPLAKWIHWLGARIGIFSRSANEEHGDLLSRRMLVALGEAVGLELVFYNRFLFWTNQLFIFVRAR